MKNSFTKKQLSLAVACAMALGVAGTVRAQSITPAAESALVTDTARDVWKSGFGLCWHSGFGPAPEPTAECDPNYKPVAQAAKAAAPAPQAVAVTPAPQPVAIAAVAPVSQSVVTKVTIDADTLFDFDKAVLRPEGRTALDGFIGKLDGLDLEKITAIGHTDRLGSDRYNQILSDKRAEAVKTYLVAKGIQPGRVQTEGMGETQPVTKAGECQGPKGAQVIACLQPDRRVDVEVVGSRTTQ